MDDNPTTYNGPLHNPTAELDDRRIVAVFEDLDQARLAERRLLEIGVPADRIHLMARGGQDVNAAATVAPPDRNLIGKIREAIWPDHGTEAYRDAVKEGLPMLTVAPRPDQVESIIGVLESRASEAFRRPAGAVAQYRLSRRAALTQHCVTRNALTRRSRRR